MSYQHFYEKASFTVAFLFLLLAMHGQLDARTEADQIQKKVAKTIEVRQETHKKEDAWAGKKSKLMAQYRSLRSEKENLEKLKVRTEQRFNIKKNLIAEARRKIEESERIREELQSYLESVVAQLDEFIKKDLPFLSKERSARLGSIKETLERPDRPAAEKYRRIMEALQVETEYGRIVEVYNDTVDLDGQSVLVDILRLGRLSLFCQTPDGNIVGHYDRTAGTWVSLSPGYRRNINKAMDIARRERAIDLVKLPIGRLYVP